MRTIGNLASEKAAARFSDFLFIRGIENQFEPEDDGTFSLWIIDEEHLARAAELLATFRRDPGAPDFEVSDAAEKKRRADEQAATSRLSTVADADRLAYEGQFVPAPYLTYLLIAASVAVAIYSNLGENTGALHHLLITEIRVEGDFLTWSPGLVEVRAGQVWRLVTPIFVHFGLLHIVFNMMMLKDLGAFIERRFGALYMLGIVVVSGVLSNAGQFLWSGPVFGGMSGIVYALFGFLWMRGKHDPTASFRLNPSTVYSLIGWFVICVFGIIPHVANVCHGVGLGVGMAWGWLSARHQFSR